jgi:hypothetical protein
MYNGNIIDWLFDNRHNIILDCQPLIQRYSMLLKTTERMFFLELTEQFSIAIREHIAIEGGKALGQSPADIMECLEDLNLELYMNGDNK